ncbi:MAG: DNA polymerase IV [Epsilonproteobacteria bacterium]|nr:DNA polymerase IV [Campylobacterota bacterium]
MILHLDLDAFFASAHRTIDSRLRDRPIAVGGRSNLKIFEPKKVGIKLYNNNAGAFVNPVFYSDNIGDFKSFFVDHIDGKEKIRGIITTASYEARAFGIKTGMSVNEALGRCPDLIVIPPNYLLYHDLSHRLHIFLKQQIPDVEQYSIDEFFGDVSGWVEEDEVVSFAQTLQAQIAQRFGLPISIGISSGKWIAKLATEFAKPKKVYLVTKEDIPLFIKDIKIEEFPGIGKGYAKRLRSHFITTLGEASENRVLFEQWKKPGIQLYKRIIGEDNEGILQSKARQSIGISRTFDSIKSRDEVKRRIMILARHIVYLVFKQGVNPTTYYMRIGYDYGMRVKHRQTVDRLFHEKLCKAQFLEMFEKIDTSRGFVTKLTMSVSNFSDQNRKSVSLLEFNRDKKHKEMTQCVHKLREKYSLDIVKNAQELFLE